MATHSSVPDCSLSFSVPSFPTDVLFLFQDPVQSTTWHFFLTSPESALVSDSFWVCLCFFMTLNVEKYWPSILQNVLQPGFLRCFSDAYSEFIGLWEEYHRGYMPFSAHCIREYVIYTHISLGILNFITWLKYCLSAFSSVKLSLLPLPLPFFASKLLSQAQPKMCVCVSMCVL